MLSIIERAREFLVGRKAAYERTFPDKDIDARIVLEDLAKFCRAHESTANKDPHVASRLDGRREVWLRIQHHLKLDSEYIWRIYMGSQPKGDK